MVKARDASRILSLQKSGNTFRKGLTLMKCCGKMVSRDGKAVNQ